MPDLFYPPPDTTETVMPYSRTVGHECEYSNGATLANWLHEHGWAGDRNLHGYGCTCAHRDLYPIHPTSDGSAPGGEYIIGGSRGVVFGSEPYITAVRILAEGVAECRNEITTRVGMHTHVGLGDLTTGDQITLLRNYLTYEEQILQLAAGSFTEVRNNGNAVPRLQRSNIRMVLDTAFWTTNPDQITDVRLPSRPTLNFHTGKGTVEFRVWNSARAAWRMVLAAAISTAMVEAAKQRRYANNETPGDLTDFLRGLLTPDILVLVDRQRKFQAKLTGRI